MKKLSIVLSLLMVATISFAQAPGGQGFPGGGQMNFNPEEQSVMSEPTIFCATSNQTRAQ